MRRHRVVPAPSPGMASPNPFQRQPTPTQRAVTPNGLQRVGRTTRRKPAVTGRANQKDFRGRKHTAIQPDAERQYILSRIHDLLSFLSKPALRNVVKKSRSTSVNVLPAIDGRATSTSSTACSKSCWCSRKLSRINRRARFRTTAPPIRPAVITPSRELAPSGSRRQLAIRQPFTNRLPFRRTRAKSRPCLSRAARPNPSPSGVPPPMPLALRPASNASARSGAGCAGSLARSCSNCGSGIHAAVCGEFSTVDIVAS
jgi:hypothetical protein